MTMISITEATSRDAYTKLLARLERQYGHEESVAIAAHYLDAELADFHWQSRIAERWLGTFEGADEEQPELARVGITGQLKGTWFVATCLVDGEGAVHELQSLRLQQGPEEARIAFDGLH